MPLTCLRSIIDILKLAVILSVFDDRLCLYLADTRQGSQLFCISGVDVDLGKGRSSQEEQQKQGQVKFLHLILLVKFAVFFNLRLLYGYVVSRVKKNNRKEIS